MQDARLYLLLSHFTGVNIDRASKSTMLVQIIEPGSHRQHRKPESE